MPSKKTNPARADSGQVDSTAIEQTVARALHILGVSESLPMPRIGRVLALHDDPNRPIRLTPVFATEDDLVRGLARVQEALDAWNYGPTPSPPPITVEQALRIAHSAHPERTLNLPSEILDQINALPEPMQGAQGVRSGEQPPSTFTHAQFRSVMHDRAVAAVRVAAQQGQTTSPHALVRGMAQMLRERPGVPLPPGITDRIFPTRSMDEEGVAWREAVAVMAHAVTQNPGVTTDTQILQALAAVTELQNTWQDDDGVVGDAPNSPGPILLNRLLTPLDPQATVGRLGEYVISNPNDIVVVRQPLLDAALYALHHGGAEIFQLPDITQRYNAAVDAEAREQPAPRDFDVITHRMPSPEIRMHCRTLEEFSQGDVPLARAARERVFEEMPEGAIRDFDLYAEYPARLPWNVLLAWQAQGLDVQPVANAIIGALEKDVLRNFGREVIQNEGLHDYANVSDFLSPRLWQAVHGVEAQRANALYQAALTEVFSPQSAVAIEIRNLASSPAHALQIEDVVNIRDALEQVGREQLLSPSTSQLEQRYRNYQPGDPGDGWLQMSTEQLLSSLNDLPKRSASSPISAGSDIASSSSVLLRPDVATHPVTLMLQRSPQSTSVPVLDDATRRELLAPFRERSPSPPGPFGALPVYQLDSLAPRGAIHPSLIPRTPLSSTGDSQERGLPSSLTPTADCDASWGVVSPPSSSRSSHSSHAESRVSLPALSHVKTAPTTPRGQFRNPSVAANPAALRSQSAPPVMTVLR